MPKKFSQPPTPYTLHPNLGFTLVEVLVAISIIALVGAVSIPNFRRFSEEQTIKNTTANFISALRTAQTNAQTGVQCPNAAIGESWSLKFNTATSPNTYNLEAACHNQTTNADTTIDLDPTSLPSTVSISAPTGSCLVTFTRTGVSGSSCFTTLPLTVTLKDNLVNPPTRVITIDPGGAISCQDGTSAANPC